MSTALVVDDSRAIRLMLSQIMAKLGFDVVQAENGKQALDTLEQNGSAIEVIMVDWNMPQVSGLEFLKRIRTQPAFAHVPIVMVTTKDEIEDVVAALQAGANEYIMKPFTPEIISDKLRLVGALK